jgi:hypothetical protein
MTDCMFQVAIAAGVFLIIRELAAPEWKHPSHH